MITRRTPADSRIERQIITGMVISTEFISGISTIVSDDSFMLPFCRTIANWCIEYFHEFKEAPKQNIQDMFAKNKSTIPPETEDAIREFLADISEEYVRSDNFNVKYQLKQAEDHFRLCNISLLKEDISKLITSKDVEAAEARIKGYRRVSMPESKGIDILRSSKAIIKSLSQDDTDVLLNLPGALGAEIGPMKRGNLFGVLAASGVGKTWWLMYLGLRAWVKNYNVLFISLEMSEEEMLLRIYSWLTGLPSLQPESNEYIKIPVFDCLKNQTGECKLRQRASKIRLLNSDDEKPSLAICPREYKPCTFCLSNKELIKNYQFATWWKLKKYEGILTLQKGMEKRDALLRTNQIRGTFKLQQFPSRSITMDDFKIYLQNLEYYERFVPDVIITDYADKFKRRNKEERHGLNEIWEDHKGIAQEKNVLVVTASQSNTARSGKKIKQGDWAEDIRKLNLIDGGFSINMTPSEEQDGIYRCGIIKRRHGKADRLSEIIVLNQLEIGKPYLNSMKLLSGRNA